MNIHHLHAAVMVVMQPKPAEELPEGLLPSEMSSQPQAQQTEEPKPLYRRALDWLGEAWRKVIR